MSDASVEPHGQGVLEARLVQTDGAERLSALEREVRELTARLAAQESAPSISAADPKLADRLADRVDVLAGRMDTLSEIARSASGAVVARETELAAVRHELGELRGRIEGAVEDLHRLDRAPVEALQRKVSGLSSDVAALGQGRDRLEERLGFLASAGENAGVAMAGHERALAELRADVEATGVRMDSVVAVVRDAVESLLSQVGTSEGSGQDAELSGRVEELTGKVDALVGDARRFGQREQELVAAQRALEERLEELARRLPEDEAGPRLVTWGAPSYALAGDEDAAAARDGVDARDETVAPSFADSALDSAGESDARGPIASLGGGR